MTIETAADRIVKNITADLASLNAVGCRAWHNSNTIAGWSQRIVGQIESLAVLLGHDHPTVENLFIDLGRAITEAKVNLFKADRAVSA